MNYPANNLSSTCDDTRGQAFVEFALVMPVYLFTLICFVQLVLIMNAKLCLEYAAFAAARAGVVNRGNMDNMKAAAATVLAPFFPLPGAAGMMSPDIVTLTTMREIVKTKIAEDISAISSEKPIAISILNTPSPVDAYNGTSSTFALSQDQKLLRIKVDFDFPLVIPLANKIIKELSEAIVEDVSTLSGRYYKRGDYDNVDNISIRISSTCALRLTTLTSSGG